MGLKKGKYMYIEIDDRRYLKVRILKGRAKDDASRYIPLGVIVSNPPKSSSVMKLSELPPEVVNKIKIILH